LDLRFDRQIVALKKGMQPIQFIPGAMPFIQLGNISDSTLNADTTSKPKPAPVAAVNPKKDTIPSAVANKPLATKEVAPIKVQSKPNTAKPVVAKKPLGKGPTANKTVNKTVKASVKKTSANSNNKANNKSLNKVNKTAKAEMPKKV
jgi:hypothetical protein